MTEKRETHVSPATVLDAELRGLRHDLKLTVRAYSARLEEQLMEVTKSIFQDLEREEISKERAHQLRDMTTLLRKRKLKPAKGRRKDLRELDEIVGALHLLAAANGDHR